jgi:hypothetical protein
MSRSNPEEAFADLVNDERGLNALLLGENIDERRYKETL